MDKRAQVISIFFSVFFIIAVLGIIALESANLSSSGDISRISNSYTLTDNAYQSLVSAYQSSNSLGLSPTAAALMEETIVEISNNYFINYHLNLSLESGLSSAASSLTGQPFIEEIPLTIDNAQNAGESTFQQMINITSSDPGWSYISKNPFGQNVEFIYPNGQIIPSWLQGNTSNSGIWWIKLGSLPANSAIKIYMIFAPTNINLFNGNTVGRAPVPTPINIQEYIPVTIDNSQSSATVSPFEEELNVPSSVYSSYAASNLQNVEFYYPNGTIIRSWLENQTSSNAIWWLKLGSIPASSSITVYMGFASTATNLLNNEYDGEAPQLSPSYAEYDDGFNVFNFYDDFKGTSLNTSKWTSSGTISVDNGVTLGAGGTSGSINTISTSVVPSDMDLMGITYGTFDATSSFGGISMNYGLNAPLVSYITYFEGSLTQYYTYVESSNTINSVRGNVVSYSGTHTGLYTFNASNDDHLTMDLVGRGVSSVSSSSASPYGNFSALTDAGPEIINYIAIASLPPNGVMPSASFGSATSVSSYGEYDNGADVFNEYWNFGGTSVPSAFTVVNPSGVTVDNGLYVAPQPNEYAGIQYNGVFSPNSVVEYDELNSYSINSCWAVGEAVGSFNSSGGYIYVYNQGGSSPSPMGWSGGSIVISNGIAYNSIFSSVPRSNIVIGEAWPRENLQVYYAGNQVADESSTSETLINSGISFSFGGYYCTNGSSISAGWIRIRTYPPNGVMPSVSFG